MQVEGRAPSGNKLSEFSGNYKTRFRRLPETFNVHELHLVEVLAG